MMTINTNQLKIMIDLFNMHHQLKLNPQAIIKIICTRHVLKQIIFQGCEINWKKGKNVTVKTIKKKQKHKSRGSVRTVTKSVQADSFFNFFTPPTMPDDPNSTLASDVQVC